MKAILSGVIGATVAVVALKGYEALAHWAPDSTTAPIVFSSSGPKPEGIIQLNPNGVLSVNVPAVYGELQKQAEAAKKAPKEKK